MAASSDVVAQLVALKDAISAYPDPRRASAEWKQAYNLLKKTDVAKNRVDNIVAGRKFDEFTALLGELSGDGDMPDDERPDEATCAAAMRAFRKRLKLTRLDEESNINSRNPLTSGQASAISSIQPPREFDDAVWRELARQGKLRRTGAGFYELADG